MKVAGLILAAGMSARMGRNKLLAEIGGEPMVRRVAAAALATGALSPVSVVLGHEREAVRRALAGLPLDFVDNPDFASGLSSSLRRGLASLPEPAEGALILLGDMPLIGPETLARLVAAFDPASGRAICVPVCQGRRGNPVLLGRRFFPEIARLSGDTGARNLIRRHEDCLAEVEVADPAIFLDIDTPDALPPAASPD